MHKHWQSKHYDRSVLPDDRGFKYPRSQRSAPPKFPTCGQCQKENRGCVYSREIIYAYLTSSDFVSTFSATLVWRVVPEHPDEDALADFLMVLSDTLGYYLEKVSCNGAEADKKIADALWQKRSLLRVFLMHNTTQGPMGEIAAKIDRSITRRRTHIFKPALYRASFSMDWDPRSFLTVQCYNDRPEETLDHVITLSGTPKDGQALGCAEYLRQTWPSGGDCVLALLKHLLRLPDGQSSTRPIDFTEGDSEVTVSGFISGSLLTVNVHGLCESIIRIGQQLCWLGAVLRLSPSKDRIAYCQPIVSEVEGLPDEIPFTIDFDIRLKPREDQAVNGECWLKLFKSLVIAKDFPVRRQVVQHSGLEVPLNVLGRLVPSRWVSTFDGKVYIKGYSSVLVPTMAIRDTVVWHLISDDEGQYLSYVDSRIEATPGLYPATVDCNLGSFRHIVGWCCKAKTLTGSPYASYDVEWSGLNKVDNGCGLAGVTISRGTAIPNLQAPAMGTKDKTFDSDFFGEYIKRLQWAARKRGWLVDGATALLHLVRASLRFSSAEDEVPENTTARSASIAVLKSPHNLGLRLVEEIYHLLEKVLAHQAQIGGVLEGFDFMDLAGDTDNFRARMIDPSISLPRWLGLAENLDAPPCGVLNVCDSWTTVPLEKDYLAVRGNNFWSPWRLFENCPELRHKPEEKCNHAQIISPARLEPQGAVIFDGSPVSPPSSTIDCPDTDSGISVEYSPNSAGKRPMHTLAAPSDPEKRRSKPVSKFIHRMDSACNHATIDPDDYTVGWICALHVELNAARRMLDRVHARGFGHGMDCNLYILGQIGKLNVVLTSLPKGQYGNNIAAVVATRMMNRFPGIEIGLMVGIGGGLPSPKNDIRLGDVVVSVPHLQYGGVVQYDMGKFTNDGFVTTGSLKAPPEKLLHVLNYMSAHGLPITGELELEYPGAELDQLFEASYPHVGGDTCEACDRKQTVQRSILRDSTTPHVFYGTIASGNSVIKDPGVRETLIKKHGVVCCEMEAAGLMNTRFPCLVIRGISDYADSHKNDIWIPYAAAAAAQYARDLLLAMPAAITLTDTVG
ncbi:hypothetical protein BJX68DRAFT_252367 [Aspergillus pseudodeflectus]|uniref:Nucleoside phosphorylase domain-containing protein n=1 Tax=Aspergillus pseudodeflectus TaxID=176178 RepID=A0ABR4L7L4_9EURO